MAVRRTQRHHGFVLPWTGRRRPQGCRCDCSFRIESGRVGCFGRATIVRRRRVCKPEHRILPHRVFASGTLIWGPTPANDDLSGAPSLTQAAGSISGSNRFATSDQGERHPTVGRSTLWWTYEAPKSGWVEFSVEGTGGPWVLSVHRIRRRARESSRSSARACGAENRTSPPRSSSRPNPACGTPLPWVSTDPPRAETSTWSWSEAEPRTWLRYAGRLASGGIDAAGRTVEFHDLGAMAFNGPALYVGSGSRSSRVRTRSGQWISRPAPRS